MDRIRKKPGNTSSRFGKRKEIHGLNCKLAIELFFFLFWMLFTGFAGYLVGYSTNPDPKLLESNTIGMVQLTTTSKKCPTKLPLKYIPRKSPCPLLNTTSVKGGGDHAAYSLEEIKRMWTCSRAGGNKTFHNVKLFPSDGSLEKTKWKTILAVEPNEFFKTYLSQYPADTASVQPVVIFSHKPLNNMKEVSQVCKVMDIAIVPDTPGVCVSVTETFHDVASYHMLHADRQPDGSFALTSNSMESRILPDERAYAFARALLSEYFKFQKKVETIVRTIPKPSTKIRTQLVGSFVDNPMEIPLFLNSFAHAAKAGVPSTKFWIFTSNNEVKNAMLKAGVHVVLIPELAEVGTKGPANIGPKLRRYFIQAWLAFAVADAGIRMLWQSPGTVWMGKPDHVVGESPEVELVWSYKGRADPRAAPFFTSFDFFVHGIEERPVHFLHEVLLHFDLVVAWDSLDTVAAYRLSENNARFDLFPHFLYCPFSSNLFELIRYGTTTFVLQPYKVLHVDLLGRDIVRLKDAIASKEPPKALVIPNEGLTVADAIDLLKNIGLWILKE